MKTNRLLALALTALCATASGSAFAQSTYTVVSLPSTAVIDSVASNGRILYEIDALTASYPEGDGSYQNYGTQTYYLTGANGVGSTQIAQATAYAGFQPDTTTFLYYQNSGTNPLGPIVSSFPSVISGLALQINSSGAAIGTPQSVYTGYAEVRSGGATTTYGGEFDFNHDPLPGVLSNSGALAGAFNGSSLTNTLSFWAPGSTSTTPSSQITLAGTVASGQNPYGPGLAISNATNRIGGSIYGASGEQAFYTGPNAHTVSYIPASAANYGSSADTINDAGQIGGQLKYLTGDVFTGVLSETAYITTSTGTIIPIGVGAVGDYSNTLFLNDANQAIIEDTTSGAYYFYSGGTVYSVDSILGLTGNDPVVGLTSSGGIVLGDPAIYTPDLSSLTGGLDNVSTPGYQKYEAFAAGSSGGGDSVPAPTGAGLFGLGFLGLLAGLRARKRAVRS
jgi:hypothetical protein